MKQKQSITFIYRDQHYELVKFSAVENAVWYVYTYSINGRGTKLFEFSDVNYNSEQAQHTAKHCLRMQDMGYDAGRASYRADIQHLING